MANNYSQTSFVLDCGSKQAADDVLQFAAALDDNSDETHPDVEEKMEYCSGDIEYFDDSGKLWFHDNGECFDTDYFDAVISYAMKKHNIEKAGYTWACTCSKPRIDEFDGGACFFYFNGNEVTSEYFNGWSWLQAKMGGN